MMLRCAGGCAGSRKTGRGGGTAVRTPCWPVRGGRSTASGYSACGARKASGSRPGGASANASGTPRFPASRLTAQRPNHVWALDFQFDQTADGRNLKLLNVVDEYTREALQMLVERRIDADGTVRSWSASPSCGVRLSTSVATTARSSPRTRFGTGAASPTLARRSSSPARRGRTRMSRASTAVCAMSCSMSKSSPASPRPRF